MGTTSEELRKLYYRLGGKDPNVAKTSTPGEALNAINELDIAAEFELPVVTSADAGKVLAVNSEGKWDAQELPNGNDIEY